MKKNGLIKRAGVTGIAIAMMMGLMACGSKSDEGYKKESNSYNSLSANASYESTTAADYEYEEYEPEEYYGDAEYSDDEDYSSEESSYSSSKRESSDSTNGSGGAGDTGNSGITTIDTEKLVYRCNMEFDSMEYDESVRKLQSLIKQYGGFLEYEDVYEVYGSSKNDKVYVYEATIRIPSSSYDDFVNSTGDLGDLKSKNHNVSNLSAEYNDLAAELEVLEAKRESYLEMMKEAKSLEDMDSLLMIDDRITEVEIQINRIKSRMNSINNDVAYSYVTVTINEVKEYEEAPAETFGERLGRGFENGWESFKEGMQDLAISFSENFPRIILAIVFILLGWFLALRPLLIKAGMPTRKQRKAKKAAKKAAAETAKTEEAPAKDAETAPAQTAPAQTAPVNEENK